MKSVTHRQTNEQTPVNIYTDDHCRGRTLLVWADVQRKFPWGIILLMGGGFALAQGAKVSCLSQVLAL